MKSLIIATMVCLLFTAGYSQNTHSHKLSIGLGNEWNAFLSPSRFLEDEEFLSRNELWDNGTYQAIALNNSFKKEGDKYRIKLKVNGSLGIYQTQQNSNRYTYRVGASYRLKYASKKYFELAPEFFRKRREGVNTDNAVLATPFSYSLLKLPVGFDFYLGNKTWIKTEFGYLYKNYDKPSGEKLLYHAPFIEGEISKKWESDSRITKLSLKSVTQSRKYVTRSSRIDEDEVTFLDGSRDWVYQFTELTLDLSKDDDSRTFGIGLYQMSRIDSDGSSTFHEVGPGIQYEGNNNKFGYRTLVKYTFRNYTRLSPGSENETPLRYQYLRANFELDFAISEYGKVYGSANLVNRTSNNPDLELLSFREYFNGYVEMGIRWAW
ncbi:hypothetical protein [Ekhidna sp.]